MQQETVDIAMDTAVARLSDATAQPINARGPRPDLRCASGRAVYSFLTDLLPGAGWLERFALKTVRGYVANWLDRNGCPIA